MKLIQILCGIMLKLCMWWRKLIYKKKKRSWRKTEKKHMVSFSMNLECVSGCSITSKESGRIHPWFEKGSTVYSATVMIRGRSVDILCLISTLFHRKEGGFPWYWVHVIKHPLHVREGKGREGKSKTKEGKWDFLDRREVRDRLEAWSIAHTQRDFQ